MPVEYKLKTLRRLFGERSMFQHVVQKCTKPRSGPTKRTDPATKATAAAEAVAEVYSEVPDQSQSSESSSRAALKPRANRPTGGVPKAFFHGTTPRAIRNKAVAGQLVNIHLMEKQKMRVYYGAIRDSIFRKYVLAAKKERFNVDAALIRQLETRLDTLLYRTGFVETPRQARQWILHNKILVNGMHLNKRGAQLQAGDTIEVEDGFVERAAESAVKVAAFREREGVGETWTPATGAAEGLLPWLVIDRPSLSAVLVRPPSVDESRAMCRAALYPYVRDAQLNPHAAMRAYR